PARLPRSLESGRRFDWRPAAVRGPESSRRSMGGRTGREGGVTRDRRVDAYIATLPRWQQRICREVRRLGHAADREVVETIKRRTLPDFILGGHVCALPAAKDHVKVFLYDGAIVPDPRGIITGGHQNTTARRVAVYEGEKVPATPLKRMFEQIIRNNRAGGWRVLKRTGQTATRRRG